MREQFTSSQYVLTSYLASKQTTPDVPDAAASSFRISKYLLSKFSIRELLLGVDVLTVRKLQSRAIRFRINGSVSPASGLFIIAPGFMKNCQVLETLPTCVIGDGRTAEDLVH